MTGHDQDHSRRQFFRGALRNVTLTFLGTGTGAAVLKRRRLVREGKCTNGGVCSGCTDFDACGLPRALSAKQALGRTRHDT